MQNTGVNNALSKEETKSIEDLLQRIAQQRGKAALEYLGVEYFVSEFFNNYPVHMEEAAWKALLTPMQFSVLRRKGTERAFSGELNSEKRHGLYCCAATKEALFSSEDKFNSGSGWPSFTKPINANLLRYSLDTQHAMLRIEVLDARSGSHLGHVFCDGPEPTGLRYCINSAALLFKPEA